MAEEVKWTGATICDFCFKDATKRGKTFIDGKTRHGPWALMCAPCFVTEGVKLGQGFGQQYDSKTLKKIPLPG